MSQFEQSITELIQEIEPRKINLSNSIYNFSQIEKANVNQLPYFLRVGKLKNNSISLPALVPFIDSKGMVYLYNQADERNAKLYIQNLLLDLIGKLSPAKIHIVIYDPTSLGDTFNDVRRTIMDESWDNIEIDGVVIDEQSLLLKLQQYVAGSKKFIEDTLINYTGFVDYWSKNPDSRQYTVFVLNDSQFIRNTTITDLINRITANTKNNNSFFILSDLDHRKANFTFFDSPFVIENHTPFYNELKIDLEYDKVKERIKENLSIIQHKQRAKPVVLETFDIKDGIKIPIGITTNNKKTHYFKFGYGAERYSAIIGGQPGKGKTNLLDAIILGGMEKYKPEELRFALFDCKGVEFKAYTGDPHILELQSTNHIPTIVDKLKIIEGEFDNRRELFSEHAVTKIEDLLKKGVPLYRVVCIVDEFESLFAFDSEFAEGLLIKDIVQKGRAYGMHLILANQSLGGSVRQSILSNIPVRIALGMTEAQSSSFLASNNYEAKNLEKGIAVYNDNNGEKDANKRIKIDYVGEIVNEKLAKVSAQQREEKLTAVETFDIKDGIKIPIGITTNNKKTHYFKFGYGAERYSAIIGGQPGKGKTVLLHTIIRRSMEKYSSEKLRYALFDCKGVSFNKYIGSSYVIECQNTDDIPTLADKLKIIEQEFEIRRNLFTQHGVENIEELFERRVSLYRLVCIVDEFQVLFSAEDYKAKNFFQDLLINKILKKGRAFGIHLVLATQSLDGIPSNILNNIPIRIALGMQEGQSTSFLSSRNTAATNLERGLAIYNDRNGEKDANKRIQVDKVD